MLNYFASYAVNREHPIAGVLKKVIAYFEANPLKVLRVRNLTVSFDQTDNTSNPLLFALTISEHNMVFIGAFNKTLCLENCTKGVFKQLLDDLDVFLDNIDEYSFAKDLTPQRLQALAEHDNKELLICSRRFVGKDFLSITSLKESLNSSNNGTPDSVELNTGFNLLNEVLKQKELSNIKFVLENPKSFAYSSKIGRGLTDDAKQELFIEQNPHLYKK